MRGLASIEGDAGSAYWQQSQTVPRTAPSPTDATDAETQHFRRWPTPTDARKWLPKQRRYRAAPRAVVMFLPATTPSLACPTSCAETCCARSCARWGHFAAPLEAHRPPWRRV